MSRETSDAQAEQLRSELESVKAREAETKAKVKILVEQFKHLKEERNQLFEQLMSKDVSEGDSSAADDDDFGKIRTQNEELKEKMKTLIAKFKNMKAESQKKEQALEKVINHLQQDLIAMKDSNAKLMIDLEASQNKTEELTEKANHENSDVKVLQAQLESYKEELRTTETEKESLAAECDELRRRAQVLKEENERALEKEVETQQGRMDKLRCEIEEKEKQKLQATLEQMRQNNEHKLTALRQALEEEQNAKQQLEKEKESLESQLKEGKEKGDDERLHATQEELTTLKAENEDLKGLSIEAEKIIADLRNEVDHLKEQVKAADDKNREETTQDATVKLSQTENELEQASKELSQTRARKAEEIQGLRDVVAGLEKQLKAGEKARSDGEKTKEKLKQVSEELTVSKRSHEEVKQEVARLSRELEHSQSQLREAEKIRKEETSLQEANQLEIEKLKQAEVELKRLAEEFAIYKSRDDAFGNQLAEARQDAEGFKEEVSRLRKELEAAEEAHREELVTKEALEAEQMRLQKSNQDLGSAKEEEVQVLRDQVRKAHENITELKEQLGRAKANLESLQEARQDEARALEAAQKVESDKLRETEEELKRVSDELARQKRKSDSQLKKNSSEMVELQEQLVEAERSAANLREELSRQELGLERSQKLESQNGKLESALRDAEKVKDELLEKVNEFEGELAKRSEEMERFRWEMNDALQQKDQNAEELRRQIKLRNENARQIIAHKDKEIAAFEARILSLETEVEKERHDFEEKIRNSDGYEFVKLAEIQSKRDVQVRILETKITELEKRLRSKDESLKEMQKTSVSREIEIEDLRRRLARDQEINLGGSGNTEYLKNVVLKFFLANEAEQRQLKPVIGTILRFSPDEMQKLSSAPDQTTPSIFSFLRSGNGGNGSPVKPVKSPSSPRLAELPSREDLTQDGVEIDEESDVEEQNEDEFLDEASVESL